MSEEQKKRSDEAAAEAQDTDVEATEAKQQAAEEEAEASAEASAEAAEESADEAAEEDEAPAEEKPKRRRRASAETSAAAEPKPAPKRAADGTVRVRAQARYVRTAPRKARLVMVHLRGKKVDDARALLTHTPRAASRDILKLLESAVANAENNHELDADDLVVAHAYVDEGPTLKRYRPRAMGRATRIRKRTSHMTIELAAKE